MSKFLYVPLIGLLWSVELCALRAQVFLPGTQPEENDIKVSNVSMCKICHSKTGDEKSEPYFSWQSGMMAHAARDPLFHAALAVANQDIEGVGEYCIRCHAPAGWLEGRSKAPDGSNITDQDRHGMSCDVCHRLIDPLSEEAKGKAKDLPPGYGNGMMLVDVGKVVRGPYGDGPEVKRHEMIQSGFHKSSELCGTCHDVSNPLAAKDIKTQPPYQYGTIERTYSEWALSDYAKGEKPQTCQSCHYPLLKGGSKAARQSSAPHRDYFAIHGPVGASTWVQDTIPILWPDDKIDAEALAHGKQKAGEMLKSAAKLEMKFPAPGKAVLRIVNLSGHKLPTGYIEGRRMWVNAQFLDAQGKLLKEIGRYEVVDSEVGGRDLKAHTLVDPDMTRVYECLPGLSEEQAAKHKLKPGKSFHFVLNDVIVKDNRIPPKGFNNAAFAERLCEPVGAVYEDGQYWDEVELELPEGCSQVKASLLFESVSWEYVRFLAQENRTNDWGKKLLDVWNQTGQCPPFTMATVSAKP